MRLSELVLSSRYMLERFSYDDYPGCFGEFCAAAEGFFASLGESMPEGGAPAEASEAACAEAADMQPGSGAAGLEAAADALMDELEEALAALPKREHRDAAFECKQILALFLTPAAPRFGEEAEAFAKILNDRWNARYPGNRYLPGSYESIMKGFDSDTLGITLRKSKKR